MPNKKKPVLKSSLPIHCAYDELRDPTILVVNPRNPNQHPKEQIALLAKIIQHQGWRAPITVSTKSGFIVRGHCRLYAAQVLNLKAVPVDLQGYENDADEWADLIADNRIAELAEMDTKILGDVLLELDTGALDMDITGFDESALESFMTATFDPDPKDDEVPEVPETPITKPGDLYVLGSHRLLCGDATKKEDVERLMDGEKADMVFTDPPYRMDAEGGSNQPIGRSAAKLGETIKHLCDFEPKDFLNLMPSVFNSGVMNAYLFCNKDLVPDYLNWAISQGYSFNILFWKKPASIPLGGQHRPDVEYLILVRKAALWNNAVRGVNYSKCLEYGRESENHPTTKPIELVGNEIQISSNSNSLVADPFLGSGTTLIACEKTGRKCFGLEIDPHYTDVCVKRWEDFTGKKAELIKA